MKRDALCTVELSSHHFNERRQTVEHTHAPRWAESRQWCKIFRWRRPCSKIAGGYGPGFQRGRWGPWWTPGCSSAWWSSEASSALIEGPRPSTWAWRLRPRQSSAPTATATATWCPGRGNPQGRNQTGALCQSVTWCPGSGIPQMRNQTEALCHWGHLMSRERHFLREESSWGPVSVTLRPGRGISRGRNQTEALCQSLKEESVWGIVSVSHLMSQERHSPREESIGGPVSVTWCPGRDICRGRNQSEALCQSLDVPGEAFPEGGIRLRPCVSHLMSRERHLPREESVGGPVSVTWCPGRGISRGRNQTEALCQSLDVPGETFPEGGISLRPCVSLQRYSHTPSLAFRHPIGGRMSRSAASALGVCAMHGSPGLVSPCVVYSRWRTFVQTSSCLTVVG